MWPILLDWGPIVLPAWHTFYMLGALAAYILLIHLARRHSSELSESSLGVLFTLTYIAGYFGARLLSLFIDEPQIKGPAATIKALFVLGPMTFYGGALMSFLVGALYGQRKRLGVFKVMDISIPAGLLALGVGRIGCFLNGDDFGKAVPLQSGEEPPWWSVTFPNLQDGIARYPVQLIEAGLVFLLVLFLATYFEKIRTAFRPGAVGYFGIIGYANLRFFDEFYRGDMRGFIGNTLSTSQFISVLILVGSALTIPFWLRNKTL